MRRELCPFKVGDQVRFTPSQRTCGLYQDIERFGVAVGKVYQIKAIKDDMYLYFGDDKGGWPWSEFTAVPWNGAREEPGRR